MFRYLMAFEVEVAAEGLVALPALEILSVVDGAYVQHETAFSDVLGRASCAKVAWHNCLLVGWCPWSLHWGGAA